jgi:hypothetical protein
MVRRACVVAVALAAAAPAAVAEVPADRVEQARQRTLTDDYQATRPGAEGATTPTNGNERKRTRRPQVDTREQPANLDAGILGTIIQWLMWALVAVAAGLLAFWIATELSGLSGDTAALAEGSEEPAAGPDLRVIERPLGDAEELARRGDFTEAVHTLLLRTLQELVRSTAVRVSPALTSREILALVPLAPDAREALADLITAVERTHFRGTAATQPDYERCRAKFQVFATAFRAGGVQVGAAA